MNKIKIICLVISCLFIASPVTAQQVPATGQARQTVAQARRDFKARRKQINKLVRQYKKASDSEKPAIKAQLEEVVSQSMDDGIAHMKQRLVEERTHLDQWEKKIKEDEANLPQLKAQWVDDLLTGEAKRKHRQAKKKWKKQLKQARRRNFHK